MSSCKIFYTIVSIIYLFVYFSGLSWINPEEDFSWPRFVFLLAMLILLDKYQLVPNVLTCPLFYPIYKVVGALIVANVALVSLWWQMEDFLKWALTSFAALFQYVPLVKRKLAFGESPTVVFAVHILVAVYFLLWVVASTGILSRGGSSCPPASPCAPSPKVRRRRSRSRC